MDVEIREGFAGGCYRNNETICVAEPEDFCDPDTFISAHFLRANSGHPLRYCAYILEDVMIGRCGVSGECTNRASRCADGGSTWDYDPLCTIIHDLRDGSTVKYGKCGDRCVWSEDDCRTGEVWTRSDPACTANHVEIGSCFGGYAFCGVSVASCSSPVEPYYTHEETLDKIGAKCILSTIPVPEPEPTPTTTTTTATTTTTSKPNPLPTRPPTYAPPTPAVAAPVILTTSPVASPVIKASINSDLASKDDGLSSGTFMLILSLVAIFAGLVIGFLAYRARRGRFEIERTGHVKPPIKSVQSAAEVKGLDDEELSVHDDF